MIKIVNIKNMFVFPIFKNGKSSIDYYAKEHRCQWLLNEQCNRTELITVFLRKPHERFISGVHSFIEFEKRKNKNLDYDTMLYAIENYNVTNEHFQSQYRWIEGLSKYFAGVLELKTVNDLYKFIPNRNTPRIPRITDQQKDKISKIHFKELKYDDLLFNKYIDCVVPINQLLKDIKNAVS